LGIIVAWDDQRKIFDFVLYAWSGLGAAFGPTLLCLLYYRRTTWAGVIAGMIAGFATSIIWVEVYKEASHGLYEAIPGFIVAFVATLGVSAVTKRETPQQGSG
ncbi:MAG: sodium/proline symporter, partial [Gammaproteobacteria bacterium]|nr:sodium/proline symporter [Gammaproteobacteria bacterium]